MTQHYLETFYAGLMFSETGAKEVPVRDVPQPIEGRAYAYRYFDREVVVRNREVLRGDPKNYGPRHIKGEVYDLERVKKEVPDSRILQSNMTTNGWERVVKCAQGFVPMESGDVVIS